jgi:hypothetical protein
MLPSYTQLDDTFDVVGDELTSYGGLVRLVKKSAGFG